MATAKQVAAIKYLVTRSHDANKLAKRIALHLLDASGGLHTDVCLSLVEGREGFSAVEVSDAGHSFARMLSMNLSTHLNQVMVAAGTGMHFTVHFGDYDPARASDPFDNSGQFAGWPEDKLSEPRLALKGTPMRYSFWLAATSYSRTARLAPAGRTELEAIDLTRTWLYDHD